MNERTRFAWPWQWLAVAALCGLAVATARAQYVTEPAPGILLVAADQMADPRFSHSVVLLIQHDDSGSWGVIINKPTGVSVSKVLPGLPSSGKVPTVYFGGPVQVDHLLCLYEDANDQRTPGTGLPGVHWSDSEKDLKAHLANPAELRVYAGYAGWAPGQLQFEIAHGGWKLIRGHAANVFSRDPKGLWRQLTDMLGGGGIPI